MPTRAHKTPLRRPTSARLHRPTPAPSPRFPYDAEGCHWLYRQEHVPSFYLEVTPETWARLQEDLGLAQQRLDADEDDTPYHPLTSFRYEDVTFRRAQIRLRGNPDFWPGMGKMQFQVSFDEDDRDGHFLGLRKILFDSATFNRSFLRDRLAYSIARESGIAAPCANNARVYVNGEYYGLFTNIEKIDEVFLWHRLRAPMGDLWKRAGWQLKTNKDLTDTVRQQVLVMADSYAALDAVFNIPINIRVLAYEALLPAVDGAWAGGLNGYYYDDPHSGRFVELPWDYDGAFTQSDNKYLDPLRWKKTERYYGRPF
ncbi:MAG: CotH kinase family protein, partial [Myxococcales bacterium]|nr:CotH kinase family protein [Myxococcales bacterium]